MTTFDPREFSCMDDNPFNNGWGYNSPEPRDDRDEDIDEEDLELENNNE